MINQIKPNISSNPNVFSPFLNKDGVNYAITKPYCEESAKETKKIKDAEKDKRSNALGASIAMTSLVAGFGVLALVKGLPSGSRIKIDKFFNYLEKKVSTLKKNDQQSNFQKFYVASLEKIKKLTGKSKGIFNAGSIKDASFKAAIDKVPFLKKLDIGITKLFEKISINTSIKSYSKTMTKFEDLYATFSEVNVKFKPKQKAKINQLIRDLKAVSKEGFAENASSKRLNETKADLNGLHEKVRDRIFNVKDFIKDKETYTKFFPEELASGAKAKLQNNVNPYKEKITKNMDEILNIYKEALPENEFLKIQKQAQSSMKSLNKSINTETNKLFDKLRDLEIGSAPTEILGLVTTTGAIGWGLTKAENKDERTSVALKYGIPAFGAILTSLYCTMGLISGGAALFLGLTAGGALNKIGEAADEFRKKFNESPTTIPKPDLEKTNV